MPALALAEDHALLDASIGVGAIVARTSTVRVTTSARRAGRAAGGFSDLREPRPIVTAETARSCHLSPERDSILFAVAADRVAPTDRNRRRPSCSAWKRNR